MPKAHIWVECECERPKRQRNFDSLTTFGPISQAFVLGEVQSVVWPLHRRGLLKNVMMESVVGQLQRGQSIEQVQRLYSTDSHSQVFSSEAIQHLFNIN